MRAPTPRPARVSATPANLRLDVREALRILDGTGLTLVDAARLAVGQGRRGASPVALTLAVERFLRDRQGRSVRPATLEYYRRRLDELASALPGRTLAELRPEDVEGYLETMPAGSRPVAWRAIRALVRWGHRQREPLVGEDWTRRVEIAAAPREREIQYLTSDQCLRLLTSDPAIRAPLALGLFAGIRPVELTGWGRPGLAWADVDQRARIVRVPAAVAKTRRARVLEGLPEALWGWLATVEPTAGPVWPLDYARLQVRIRRALAPDRWPTDGARHTFATMAVAGGHDLTQVSLWMGHEGSPTLLHRHYRGLATLAEAGRFWGLRP